MNIKLLFGVLILALATCSIYSPTPSSGIEGQVFLGRCARSCSRDRNVLTSRIRPR